MVNVHARVIFEKLHEYAAVACGIIFLMTIEYNFL